MPKTNETYVPLSRGLLDHLPDMSGLELKIYVAFLLIANPFDRRGAKKGSLSMSSTEIAELLGADRGNVSRAIKCLSEKGYIGVERSGKNQHRTTTYTIKKYKNVSDFAAVSAAVSAAVELTPAKTAALQQHDSSTTAAEPEDASVNACLQPYKNIENIENNNKSTTVPPNPPKGEPIPYQKIVSLYNEICVSLPKVQQVEARKRDIAARWKSNPSLETFEGVFRRAEESDFLSGRTDRWRGASFDWLMNAKNFAKVIEGNYDNRQVTTGSQQMPRAFRSLIEMQEGDMTL